MEMTKSQMMASRRGGDSPTGDIITQLEERSGGFIEDRGTFNVAYNDYMNFTENDFQDDSGKDFFRDKVFMDYRKDHPGVDFHNRLKDAKKEDSRRDNLKTARTIITPKQDIHPVIARKKER